MRVSLFSVKHHFVPEFFLKSWSDTTSDNKIEVFRLDLSYLPSSRLTPEYTGYEKNLYALTKPDVSGVNRQAVETEFLKRIDSDGAKALQKMRSNGLAALTAKDLVHWVLFTMSLRFRSPEVVTRLRTEAPIVLKKSLDDWPEEYTEIADACDPPTLAEYFEQFSPGHIENFGVMSLPKFICGQKNLQSFLQMKCLLFDFSGQKNQLLLADRPCIFSTHFDDPELIVALPISPWKAFMTTRTDRVARILTQQHPKELLMRINESSLRQAKLRVYARNGSARRFIVNRLKAWATR